MGLSKGNAVKLILLAAWAVGGSAAVWLFLDTGLKLSQVPEVLRDAILEKGRLGPLFYIVLHGLRPLVLFPAAALALAAGLVWGPLGGAVYTLIGESLGAASGFWLARVLGHEWMEHSKSELLHGIDRRLQECGFMTVLILRLLMLPFDPVNFACGLSSMSFRTYAAATFLGVIPGVVAFVLLGSGWSNSHHTAFAVGLFALALLVAYLIKRSKAGGRVLKPPTLPGE